MSNPLPRRGRMKSLADYLVRYDLATILADARHDYGQSAAGAPRLLDQKDIAARFRKSRPAKPASNE